MAELLALKVMSDQIPYMCLTLILKAPIKTAADNVHKYFFIVFSKKIRLDVSSASSARQTIHMKNQALFSLTGKSKQEGHDGPGSLT